MGIALLSCEMDVRVGGGYRLAFAITWNLGPLAPRFTVTSWNTYAT